MTKANLWSEEEIQKQNKRTKYLITAGKNRYGREQYVNYYNDTDEWDISIVPLPLGKTKAIQLLPKIKREYNDRVKNKKSYSNKYPNIEFELKEIE